jgi:hypothetical protein
MPIYTDSESLALPIHRLRKFGPAYILEPLRSPNGHEGRARRENARAARNLPAARPAHPAAERDLILLLALRDEACPVSTEGRDEACLVSTGGRKGGGGGLQSTEAHEPKTEPKTAARAPKTEAARGPGERGPRGASSSTLRCSWSNYRRRPRRSCRPRRRRRRQKRCSATAPAEAKCSLNH